MTFVFESVLGPNQIADICFRACAWSQSNRQTTVGVLICPPVVIAEVIGALFALRMFCEHPLYSCFAVQNYFNAIPSE